MDFSDRAVEKQLASIIQKIEEGVIWRRVQSEDESRHVAIDPSNWIEDLYINLLDKEKRSRLSLQPNEKKICRTINKLIKKGIFNPTQEEIAKEANLSQPSVSRLLRAIHPKLKYGLRQLARPDQFKPHRYKYKRRGTGEAINPLDLGKRLTTLEPQSYGNFLNFCWQDAKEAKAIRQAKGLDDEFINGAAATFAFIILNYCQDRETEFPGEEMEVEPGVFIMKPRKGKVLPLREYLNSLMNFFVFLLFDKGKILSKDFWGDRKIRSLLEEESSKRLPINLRTKLFGLALTQKSNEILVDQPDFFTTYFNEELRRGEWRKGASFRTYLIKHFREVLKIMAEEKIETEEIEKDETELYREN
jgi:hypothetical protein